MITKPRGRPAASSLFALLCTTPMVFAQGTAPPPAPPPATTKSLAASAGVFAYPQKNQTPAQQAQDEGECYNWSKTQSGYDPMQPPPATTTAAAPGYRQDGERAKGALRGAAGGAAIGAIAGDTGKGAAIGATAGVLAGGRRSRMAQSQEAEQAASQSQANLAQLQNNFKQGMRVCLEARGYAAK
jgi:Glycine-zipper domain